MAVLEVLPARSGSILASPNPSAIMVSTARSMGRLVTRLKMRAVGPFLLMERDEIELVAIEDETGEASAGKLGGPGGQAEGSFAAGGGGGGELRGYGRAVDEGMSFAMKLHAGEIEIGGAFLLLGLENDGVIGVSAWGHSLFWN